MVDWVGTSGNWTIASNWSGGVLPGPSDNVNIDVAGITVTLSAGLEQVASLNTSLSTLSLSGGELDTGNYAILNGAYQQSGGTLQLAGQGATFNGSLNQSGGSILLTNGTLAATGTVAVSGGTLSQSNGTLLFEAATSLSGSGAITSTAGTIDSLGSFLVSGGLLQLSGNAQAANFYGSLLQTGGSITILTGGLTTYGNFTENGGSMLLNYGGGTFLGTTSLVSGTITSTAATMTVSGAYSQTGGLLSLGGRGAVFSGSMTLGTAGTITLALGALQTQGLADRLAGTITGAGTLLVAGGTTTLANGISLSLPHVDIAQGTLALASGLSTLSLSAAVYLESRGTLALEGNTLTLSKAAVLDGELVGHGTLAATAGATLNGGALDDSVVVSLSGTSNLVGSLSIGSGIGSTARLNVLQGATLRLTGNDHIYDASSKGLLNNAGFLQKTGGSSLAEIDSNFTSTGTVGVSGGSLELAGRTTTLGGSIAGNGTLVLDSLDTTLSAGASLTIRRVELTGSPGDGRQTHLGQSLTYANQWDQEGGTLLLSGTGVTLGLSGVVSLEGGLITGAGTVATTANVDVDSVDIEGPTILSVAGTATQTGTTFVGNQPGHGAEVIVAAGASWFIEQDSSILGGNGTILNNGLLDKRNGSAGSTITATLDNNGKLAIGNGTLVLAGQATLGGTISGAGVLALTGTETLASGLILTAAQTEITGNGQELTILGGGLADAKTFSMDGGTLQLNGNTLTLSGPTVLDGGLIGGIGTPAGGAIATGGALTLSGTANDQVTIGPNASLLVGGPAEQVNSITLGDQQSGFGAGLNARLQINAGATYTLDGGANIQGNGTISLLGTLSLPDNAPSTISAAIIGSGVIQAGNAQLTFLGALEGNNTVGVGPGGYLDFRASVGASETVQMNGTGASILIERPSQTINGAPDPLAFAGTITGFSAGDFIQLGELNSNSASLALTVSGNTISVTDGQVVATLDFASTQTTSTLSLGNVGGYVTIFHS